MRSNEIEDVSYGIAVVDKEITHQTSMPNYDEEWGDRGDTATDHYIQGFKAAPAAKNEYFDLIVPFEPKFGEVYYLLYGVYSTGDSFGHDAGHGIEYFELYTKDELPLAERNKKILSTATKHSVNIYNRNGKEYNVYLPWIGHFESLDYVMIESVQRMK